MMASLRSVPAAVWLLALALSPVRAETGSIVIPTIGPHTMADIAADINAAFLAAETCQSGTTAPTNGPGGATFHYQCWIDTSVSPNLYKIRDNATTWITLGAIDNSAHTFTWTALAALTGIPTAPTAAADTNTTQLATTAFVLGQAASATPLIDGTAGAGTSLRYARGDHVHPTDTTRAPAASPQFTGVVNVQGALKLSTESAPAQITVDQNDYNPGSVNCASSATLLLNASAAKNITGLAGGVAGCLMAIVNDGSFAITLKDESTSSSAANRFGFGADLPIAAKQGALLKYDATNSRWRQIGGVPQSGAGGGTMTSVTAGQGCVSGTSGQAAITTSGTINCAPGFANKLRNSGLTSWFHGTGPTITTAGGTCAEGTFVVPTGASVVCSRLANTISNPLSFYEMVITGATSVTDVVVRYVIESFDAAPLAGQQVTCQWPIFNNTGGSITPTLTVKRANTQDATYTNTDVSAASLQTVGNGATGILAYSWAANANSFNGLSVDVDFGNNFSTGAKSVIVGGGFDCRVTPGVSTGTVASPPAPEIPPAAYESAWNMRSYEATYDNGVAAGTVTAAGEQDRRNGAANADLWNVLYKVQKRADATLTLYSPNSGTSAKCYDNTGAADIGAGVFNSSNGTNGASVSQTSGTSAVGDAIRCHWTADAILVGG